MLKKLLFILLIFATNNTFSQCLTPVSLSTSNITFSNAQANWGAISGAYRYVLKYRICGTTQWSSLQTYSPDSSRNIPSLQQATCYEWTVRTFCDSTNNQIRSDWSDTISFTTATFVASQFNPLIINNLDTNYCGLKTSLKLYLSQTANEPDIESSTLTSDKGSFDLNSMNIGDSVGYAILTTNSQTINASLRATLVFTNYAMIQANDSSGGIVGFFTIENLNPGIKVSSTSPNDGNNYTSGLTSEVYFGEYFVNPDYSCVLNFYTELESELNDLKYDTTSLNIICNTTGIMESVFKPKRLLNSYNILGTEAKRSTGIVINIYSDGSVEKTVKTKY